MSEDIQARGAAVPKLRIREACEADMAAVREIYAHYVEHSLATFEEVAPSIDEMNTRLLAVHEAGLPYLVGLIDGEVLGYAYATPYRSRPAYRHTIENSVYVAVDRQGHGYGSALLEALIAQCEAGPWRQMLAVIGDSGNTASIALHGRYGFEPAGTLRSVGFKLGRWVDTVLMQRSLGPGDQVAP
ncbi:N-acetyltransferase family protein [Alkalicaulis satelles]|uniref:N-acetyltransferase family protein n=1 Tax=Alkalicaulis satelles TaxID=2609175 RepID=A0A5M6ZN69_9PROT|nr:GNAT family N-acetyltransferase [Alkalicaulis satelles]KAA5805034.1 N-acetyltransferase family protein [Alkalicaulis satelles]